MTHLTAVRKRLLRKANSARVCRGAFVPETGGKNAEASALADEKIKGLELLFGEETRPKGQFVTDKLQVIPDKDEGQEKDAWWPNAKFDHTING